jgi:hypothetical protein
VKAWVLENLEIARFQGFFRAPRTVNIAAHENMDCCFQVSKVASMTDSDYFHGMGSRPDPEIAVRQEQRLEQGKE